MSFKILSSDPITFTLLFKAPLQPCSGKIVRYNKVSLYRRFFPYILLLLRVKKNSCLLCRGLHYIEVCYIEVLLYKKQILKEIVKTIVLYTPKTLQSTEGAVLPLFTPFPTIKDMVCHLQPPFLVIAKKCLSADCLKKFPS